MSKIPANIDRNAASETHRVHSDMKNSDHAVKAERKSGFVASSFSKVLILLCSIAFGYFLGHYIYQTRQSCDIPLNNEQPVEVVISTPLWPMLIAFLTAALALMTMIIYFMMPVARSNIERVPLGLTLMDNNCYVISLMQCLAHVLPNVEPLLAEYQTAMPALAALPERAPQTLTFHFLALIAAMQKGTPIDDNLVANLTRTISDGRLASIRPGYQVDPSEVLNHIKDCMLAEEESHSENLREGIVAAIYPAIRIVRSCAECGVEISTASDSDVAEKLTVLAFSPQSEGKSMQQQLDNSMLRSQVSQTGSAPCLDAACPRAQHGGPQIHSTEQIIRHPTAAFCTSVLIGTSSGMPAECNPVMIATGSITVPGVHGPVKYDRLVAFILKQARAAGLSHYVAYLRTAGGWYVIDDGDVSSVRGDPAVLTSQPRDLSTFVVMTFHR